ncbi:MAG: hypothetical protein IJ062_03555 [Firmicutes bacterium]|nr:hypothetical protein [Bacillota bacterium]
MAIIRIKKYSDNISLGDTDLTNTTLSLKAVGLLMVMLSMPKKSSFTISGLAYTVKDSVSSVKKCINELINAGYILRTQKRAADGKFRECDYYVYEFPMYAKREPKVLSLVDFFDMVEANNKPKTAVSAVAEYPHEKITENISFAEKQPAESVGKINKEKFDELCIKVNALSDTLSRFMDTQCDLNDILLDQMEGLMDMTCGRES